MSTFHLVEPSEEVHRRENEKLQKSGVSYQAQINGRSNAGRRTTLADFAGFMTGNISDAFVVTKIYTKMIKEQWLIYICDC